MKFSVISRIVHSRFICSLLFSVQLYASTGFVIKSDSTVFVGKNQEGLESDTRVWIVPPATDKYGTVFFGFNKAAPYSAMNDKGLVMEHFAGPLPDEDSASKVSDQNMFYNDIMVTCATVDDVLAYIEQAPVTVFNDRSVLFTDRAGNSILVKGQSATRMTDYFKVFSNARQSGFMDGDEAVERGKLLEKMITDSQAIDIDRAREILAAAQHDVTQYSNVYDLAAGLIYVHHFQNFDKYYLIDLKNDFGQGEQEFKIPELFPDNSEFDRIYYTRQTPQNNIAILLFLFFSGFIFLFSALAWAAFWLIRRQDARDFGIANIKQKHGKIAAAARILSGFTGILALGFAIISIQYSQLYQFGLPRNTIGLNIIKGAVIMMPTVIFWLVIPVVLATITVWILKLWDIRTRLFYSLVTGLLIVSVLFYYYWNILFLPSFH